MRANPRIISILFAFFAICLFALGFRSAFALGNSWTGSTSTMGVWESAYCSGLNCIATASDNLGIKRSTDMGNNFSSTNVSSGRWILSCKTDFSVCLALSSSGDGGIKRSTDGGATWTSTNVTSGNFYGLSCTDSYCIQTSNSGIKKSTDFYTFTGVTYPGGAPAGVSCFGTGCVATYSNGFGSTWVIYSNDSGNTFLDSSGENNSCTNATSCYNGTCYVASCSSSPNDHGIKKSTDGGATWTSTNVTSGNFYGLSCTQSGCVAGKSDGIYYSSGTNWYQSNITSGVFLGFGCSEGYCVTSGGTYPGYQLLRTGDSSPDSENNPSPTNGTCGTSARTYEASESAYSGTLCSSGYAIPSSPSFPSQGSYTTWTCSGYGLGSSQTCTAYRKTPTQINGTCGTSARTYEASESAYTGDFCTSGTVNSTPSFPVQGSSRTWLCTGSGGTSSWCTATRNSESNTGSWFPDFSGITSGIGDMVDNFGRLLTFEASYVGFNFTMEALNSVVNNDFGALGISVLDASGTGTCNLYTSPVLTYTFTSYSAGPSSDTYSSGSVRSLPYCNTSYIPEGQSIAGAFQPENEITWTNGNACTISWSYSYGSTSSYSVQQWERKFAYYTRVNDSPIVSYNEGALESLRVIPFTLILFGWDLGEFINNLVQGVMSFVLDLLFYPVNSMAGILNDIRIFWADYPDTFCFYGMKLQKLSIGNTQNFIDSDTPYTTNLGVGAFLVIVFLVSFFLRFAKKL